jgi:hypothetical protein
MNAWAASVLLSGALICAQVVADESTTVPAMPDAHATRGKLMKECLDKQRSQNGTAASDDTRTMTNSRTMTKLCAMRVRTQMQQLKDAGAVPPGSERRALAADPQ